MRAITVVLGNAPAADLRYAVLIVNKLGLEHIVHIFNEDELHEAIIAVAEALGTFDPMETRNITAIYIGLKRRMKTEYRPS